MHLFDISKLIIMDRSIIDNIYKELEDINAILIKRNS